MSKKVKKRGTLKYSQELLERFQELYFKKFREHISQENASVELNFLARLVEALFSMHAENINRKDIDGKNF